MNAPGHIKTVSRMAAPAGGRSRLRPACQDVGEANDLLTYRAGRRLAGPADQERLAEAPFPDIVLAAAQSAVDGQAGVDGLSCFLIIAVSRRRRCRW